MEILLKKAKVYTPEYIGEKDILISNSIIKEIDDEINVDCKAIDCSDKIVCPMFVDGHEHLEFTDFYNLEDIVSSGVGTAVGVLANEKSNQDVENLIEITNKINNCECGLTAFCLAGSKNFTHDTTQFIINQKCVVGIKTALFCNERPKANLSYEKLKADVLSTYNAGKVANKNMQVHIHLDHPYKMGDKPNVDEINSSTTVGNLFWIDKIVEETGVPYSLFKLTHAQKYFNKILEYANKGCFIDYTAFPDEYDRRFDSLVMAIKNKCANLSKISISSDLGILNLERNLNTKETPKTLLNTLQKLVLEKQIDFAVVIKFLTTNALAPIKKEDELIKIGSYAKLLVLNKNLEIENIISKQNFKNFSAIKG